MIVERNSINKISVGDLTETYFKALSLMCRTYEKFQYKLAQAQEMNPEVDNSVRIGQIQDKIKTLQQVEDLFRGIIYEMSNVTEDIESMMEQAEKEMEPVGYLGGSCAG